MFTDSVDFRRGQKALSSQELRDLIPRSIAERPDAEKNSLERRIRMAKTAKMRGWEGTPEEILDTYMKTFLPAYDAHFAYHHFTGGKVNNPISRERETHFKGITPEVLQQLSAKRSIFFWCTHTSDGDSAVLGDTFYDHNLPQPLFAGGDNLTDDTSLSHPLPLPTADIMRKTNVCLIPRKEVKRDLFFSTLIQELYLQHIKRVQGNGIFYCSNGRPRDGKVYSEKLMLYHLTNVGNAVDRLPEHEAPHIIPTAVSWSYIPECVELVKDGLGEEPLTSASLVDEYLHIFPERMRAMKEAGIDIPLAITFLSSEPFPKDRKNMTGYGFAGKTTKKLEEAKRVFSHQLFAAAWMKSGNHTQDEVYGLAQSAHNHAQEAGFDVAPLTLDMSNAFYEKLGVIDDKLQPMNTEDMPMKVSQGVMQYNANLVRAATASWKP